MKNQREDWAEVAALIGGWSAAVICAVVFLYTTFQTKADQSVFKGDLIQRIDRIENKLDLLLDKLSKR